MRFFIGVITALAALICVEATAQTWSADVVAQQCTTEGAFGQTFGALRANGRTGRVNRQFSDFDRTVTPPAAYSPFNYFEVKFTPHSHVIAQISAHARFGDEAEAERAYAALVDAFARGGRFAFQNEDTIVLPGGPEGISFKTEDYQARLTATVARGGRTVYLVCADGPLTTQGFEEAFSELDRRTRR